MGRPKRTGGWPGSPAVIMTPLRAWTMVSMALRSPLSVPAPKPLMEV